MFSTLDRKEKVETSSMRFVLGKNQRKIITILKKHGDLTTLEIASLVFEKPVQYKTKEYYSVHRSLRRLEDRGVVNPSERRIVWSLTKHLPRKVKL